MYLSLFYLYWSSMIFSSGSSVIKIIPSDATQFFYLSFQVILLSLQMFQVFCKFLRDKIRDHIGFVSCFRGNIVCIDTFSIYLTLIYHLL